MDLILSFLKKEGTKKILIFFALALLIYSVRTVLDFFLITFLFVYGIYAIEKYIIRKTSKFFKINQKALTIILYAVFYICFVLILYNYIPIIVKQTIDIINQILNFKDNLKDSNDVIQNYFFDLIKKVDLKLYFKNNSTLFLKIATNAGKLSLNVLLASILSMFFMIQRDKIKEFTRKFEDSTLAPVYGYIKYFAKNFINSFGKVLQAQIMIAFVNSVLSVIALGFFGFPQLLGLGVMIFFFSLIPVAGTIFSFIPLSIMAFNIGGPRKVIEVLIMIILIHAIESYFLNPKFMSDKTELPIFIVFLILIVSEHYLGVWGLLIGIPLFIFILDLLGVKYTHNKVPKKKLSLTAPTDQTEKDSKIIK